MNILFMCREFPPAPHGGTGTITYELAKRLNQKGNKIYSVSRYACEEFNESNISKQYSEKKLDKLIERVPISTIDSTYYAYKASKNVNSFLKKHKVDVIEAPSHGAESLFYSLKKSAPLVIRLHGFISKIPLLKNESLSDNFQGKVSKGIVKDTINRANKEIMWNLEKRNLLNSDIIIAPSKSIKNFVLDEIEELNKKDISVIYNGIDLKPFENTIETAPDIKNIYNIETEKKIICFAGRISKPKGVDTLIKAAAIVLKQRADVTFVLICPIVDKSLIQLCEAFIDKNNLKNIIFTGRLDRSKVYQLFSLSTFIVHPSLYEVFPTVILEGLASKKTVVASNIAPHREMMNKIKNAILFETGNYEELAKIMLRLIDNPSELEKIGLEGYNIVYNNYTIEKNAEKTLEVYSRVA